MTVHYLRIVIKNKRDTDNPMDALCYQFINFSIWLIALFKGKSCQRGLAIQGDSKL
jgi:hypothetical protein